MSHRLIQAFRVFTHRTRMAPPRDYAMTFRNGKAVPNDPLNCLSLS